MRPERKVWAQKLDAEFHASAGDPEKQAALMWQMLEEAILGEYDERRIPEEDRAGLKKRRHARTRKVISLLLGERL